MRVPTTPATVMSMFRIAPAPAASRHRTDDDDAHDDVAHCVVSNRIDGVASREPKFSPEIVTLYPPEETPFSSSTKLTDGASSHGDSHLILITHGLGKKFL